MHTFLTNHKLGRLILSLLYTQNTESKCFQVEKLFLGVYVGNCLVNYARKTIQSTNITRKVFLHIDHVEILNNIAKL